ncbi:uncharacterized protein [Montipora capricornis]|uniref:uncharacterized protein n=1 Tax=Montipora capricornis TaxID=246305 RepID=UPI0035F200C0
MAASFEEKLASAVENLPVLYDKALKEFKDSTKKKNAWQQVAQQLRLESGSFAKKKFENLRARYSREKQRIKKAKKFGTSSDKVLGALSEASDTFPYLHFLDKYISPRATKSNLVEW